MLELRGTKSNRDGIGAVVKIEAGEKAQMRYAIAGAGYASQASARLYFGLDDRPQVDVMTVRWPSGLTEKFENIKAKQLIRITEGAGMELLTFPAAQLGTQLSMR